MRSKDPDIVYLSRANPRLAETTHGLTQPTPYGPAASASCPIERGGTLRGTLGGTSTVHLSLYRFPVPTAGYRREFPRRFAPPLVGRAARPRPLSAQLIWIYSTNARRPRSH